MIHMEGIYINGILQKPATDCLRTLLRMVHPEIRQQGFKSSYVNEVRALPGLENNVWPVQSACRL